MDSSPHDRYTSMLQQTGLDKQAMGIDWLRAAESALHAPVMAATPFRETAYFPANAPTALGYRLELQRGRVLEIDVEVTAEEAAQLFVELYERRDDGTPRRVAALAPEARSLRYEVERDGVYILRVQPELLRSGRFTLTQRTLGSLPFPVQGLDAGRVQSLFGAQRDAGARLHEGIDIFATRGTPALAVSAGTAATGTNNLGGNVVWLRDSRTGRRYYYAHLDRWAFDGSMAVQPGDVVGYVGNTGNARTTSPHLHFGIYSGGAVNPLPFLRPDETVPARGATGAAHVGQTMRLLRSSALRRSAPVSDSARRTVADRGSVTGDEGPGTGAADDETGTPAVTPLPRHTIVVALGASDNLLRVRAGEREGYLPVEQLTPAEHPLYRSRVVRANPLRDGPRPTAAVIDTLPAASLVEILGIFDAFHMVRTEDGRTGWIDAAVLRQSQ